MVLKADGAELVGATAVSTQGGRIHEPPSLRETFPPRQCASSRERGPGGGGRNGLPAPAPLEPDIPRHPASDTEVSVAEIDRDRPGSPLEKERYRPWVAGSQFRRFASMLSSDPAPGVRPRPRILVIEDEPVVRSVVDLMLKREGYEVTLAENGRQGLESALASPPDLVLCDTSMPLLDGRSVLRALRSDPRTRAVQFIFLSGMNTPADHRSGMNLGADDYLSKPFSSVDLMAAIRSRLERAEAYA
ncbi:MAG TPA: response regulator transcription factor, partial [Candidatus Limnocylindria bacterium]|nr:response regulator transcription factor [Candidatus Limnocylindria bacterium]